jgi:nitroreductase/NAD-dependent dihydropyrimidine dehydrogenase PreA subunit
MDQLIIDQETCTRDGLCAAVCPARIIELNQDHGFPQPRPEFEQLCIHCGHCVAICPKGALSIGSMNPGEFPLVSLQFKPSPEQAEQFMRARRSIRTYRDQAVEPEKLIRLIKIADYAPSASNMRPVKWLIIKDTTEVRRLSGLVVDWMLNMTQIQPEMAAMRRFDRIIDAWEKGEDRICRGAPHVIVAYASNEFVMAPIDAATALAYLELAATTLGLGTCWAGYFNTAANFFPPMTEALNLPQNHRSLGAVMVGYPQFKYQRMPVRPDPPITWR